MGGDNGPAVIVAGAAAAAAALRAPVILAGRAAELRALIAEHGEVAGLLQVAPAEDTIAMDEGALASWRRPRSSVAVACQLVRRGQAAAVVSASSTGGVVATARLRLRSVPGLLRPALVVVLPTQPRPTFLIDAGAIADPKPEMLLQFAQLGVAYAQIAHNVAEPQVGLLTIGAEPGKGNKLTRRAHDCCRPATARRPADPLHRQRRGQRPAHRLGGRDRDRRLHRERRAQDPGGGDGLRRRPVAGRAARLPGGPAGAVLQRRGLRELRGRLDAESYGGAALLGLEGTVVIAHGASSPRGITSACLLAADLVKGQITEKIRERLGHGRGGHFLRRN